MGIREEERRKKISKTEREKRDKDEKEKAFEGKRSRNREKKRKKWNENDVRTEIRSERGKMQGSGGVKETKRDLESEEEEKGRKK